MHNGIVFDVKEFGLHDGDGLRTTVFLKGCPLRCAWCHNPEGQAFEPELTKNENKCTHCHLCKRTCAHKECAPFGVCLKVCPQNCLRIAGKRMTAQEVADTLLKNERFLRLGGVTFSGGEPLCQADFLLDVCDRLSGIRTAVETCGAVSEAAFCAVCARVDDVYMDLKLMDSAAHKVWTGQDNAGILSNARKLIASGRNAVFRVPLIPTVTDTDENLSAIASFLAGAKNVRVELIPYNRMTGAKYKTVGRTYDPPFPEAQALNKNTELFTSRGIPCRAF